jgi:peroxiredoxin
MQEPIVKGTRLIWLRSLPCFFWLIHVHLLFMRGRTVRSLYPWVAFLMLVLAVLPRSKVYAGEGLNIGDRAPDFTLPMATKDTLVPSGIRLSSIIGKGVIVLAFYPADWSGGCTKEMCTLRDNFAELSRLGVSVYGISGDYIYSHREWAKYHNLQFPLLSDHDHSIAKRYQSYNASTGYNLRTVYIIDLGGRIAYQDLAYSAGSTDSLEKLRAALRAIQVNH